MSDPATMKHLAEELSHAVNCLESATARAEQLRREASSAASDVSAIKNNITDIKKRIAKYLEGLGV